MKLRAVSLLIAPDGSKLSKRKHGPVVSVTTYRDGGFLPHAYVNFLCLLGWSPKNDREVMSRDELITKLKQTLGDADAALAKFDIEKLLDRQSIQGCEVSALEAILHVVEHFSMHTGQIILMTKMLAEADLSFYEFTGATPIPKWRNAPE